MPLSASAPRLLRRPAFVAGIVLLTVPLVATTAVAAGPWPALAVAGAALTVAVVGVLGLLAALARYRTSTQSFFDAAGDAVLLLEPETERVLGANAAACALYGYAHREIVGMSARALSDDSSEGEGATRSLQRGGGTVQFDSTQRRRDGSPVRVRVRATLTRVGRRPVLISINRDITDEEWFGDELARRTRELQAIADNARHLIARFDRELRYRFANRAVTELTGLSEQALLGKPLEQGGMCPEDVAEWAPALRGALDSGRPATFELGWTTDEGRRDFVCDAVPERESEGGPVTSLLCVCRDVTEQRRAETALREVLSRAAWLSHVLAQTNDGVVVTDAEGRATWVNDAMTRISGYAANEIVGRRPAHLMQPEETDPAEAARVQACVAARAPFTAERLNQRPDGTPYWVRISCSPLVEDGRFSGYVAVETDVTERKRVEAALSESEQQFRGTFENAAVGIAHVGTGGEWLRVNGRLCEILGYTRGELLGLSFQDITHPDDLESDLDHVRRLLAGETDEYRMEKRYVHKDGSVVWVTLTVSAVRSAGGAVDHFISVVEDISDRKAAEVALALQQARFQALVQHSSDVISVLDADGQIVYESPAVESVLGYRPEDLVGHSAFAYIREEDAEAVATAFGAVASNPGQAVPIAFRWRHADGRWIDLEAVGTNRLGDPAVRGIVVNSRDVGASLRYEAEREARERAEEMLRLKTAFLSNMSHEIRTPLTAILGYAEILADEVPEDLRAFAVAVRSGGERLLGTLNAVLDLAQIEAGQMSPQPRPVAAGEFLAATVQTLRPLADAKGLALEVDVPAGLPVVSLDVGLFDRVVTNLVGNAVKFTERGEVRVRARHDSERLVLEVADTGIGIAPEAAERLFEPFEQASDGHARTHEGNGLGLAIVRDVVALLGGEVTVESVLGHGARFRVSVPAPVACIQSREVCPSRVRAQ